MSADGPVVFWRQNPDGSREVAGRVWVLIWLLPVLMSVAGAGMLAIQAYRHITTVPTTAEVVRVYTWEGAYPIRGTVPVYGPVFRYTWTDGQPTDATAGMSHSTWNLDIGSRHQIRYNPRVKGNVVFGGIVRFYAGLVVLGLGLVTVLPALWASLRLRRWLRAGA